MQNHAFLPLSRSYKSLEMMSLQDLSDWGESLQLSLTPQEGWYKSVSEGRYNIPECFVHAGFLFVGPLHTLSHPSNIPVSGYFLQKKLQLSGAQGSDHISLSNAQKGMCILLWEI